MMFHAEDSDHCMARGVHANEDVGTSSFWVPVLVPPISTCLGALRGLQPGCGASGMKAVCASMIET